MKTISRWGLTYKGVEILTPEEWNTVIDALEDLDKRIKCGLYETTGDGTTNSFQIEHNLGETPTCVICGKASAGLPDIDYWFADETYITVVFKSAPDSGIDVKIYWIALKW